MIDPNDHLGLMHNEVTRAVRLYGGRREDWLGPAYVALTNAARTHDPALGNRFSSHACQCLRWALYTHYRLESGARRSDNKSTTDRRGYRYFEPADVPHRRAATTGITPAQVDEDLRAQVQRVLASLGPDVDDVAQLLMRGLTITQACCSRRRPRTNGTAIKLKLRKALFAAGVKV